MISRSKWLAMLSLLVIASFILGACKGETVIETVEVPVEVEIEKPVEVEVLITPTPEPIPQGGSVIEGSFADASILNPILYSDSPSSDVVEKIYLALIQTDPFTGELIPQAAESWSVSEDGLTYTFKLREDIFWSDGTPFTANDFKFTYEALFSDLVDSPRKDNVEFVESITVVDDYTVEVVHNTLDCLALNNLGLGILPSHMYAEDFSDIMDSPLNEAPSVTNGPFKFQEWVKDDHVTVVRNEDYYLGAPNLDGWIYRIFADQSALLAGVLAGEVDLVEGIGAQYVSVIEGEIAKGSPYIMRKYFDDGMVYLGFNWANPENPELGWIDENENGEFDEGEPFNADQELHPVLGDVLVRKAIAYSIDYTNIINKVVFGEAAPILANILPAIEWAYNADVEPYALDTEMAVSLLEEAGWVDSNGDGVREKDGVPLAFSIMTNAGNEIRENIAAIMKDNLDALGFDITLEIIEFGTVVQNLLGQQFDAVVIGWTNMGTDPDDATLFAYRYDDPGGGFNFVSYYNEIYDDLVFKAKSVPGCDPAERGPLYKQIQEVIHEDVPYAFLYVPLTNVVWNTRLQDINPGAWETHYNIEEWYLTP